ncbi:MAG: hypothetical protein JO102_04415, partial [Elusimicrobia bacterium]|nr:hypothetical protein [Elusimicrobiota bacterium]
LFLIDHPNEAANDLKAPDAARTQVGLLGEKLVSQFGFLWWFSQPLIRFWGWLMNLRFRPEGPRILDNLRFDLFRRTYSWLGFRAIYLLIKQYDLKGDIARRAERIFGGRLKRSSNAEERATSDRLRKAGITRSFYSAPTFQWAVVDQMALTGNFTDRNSEVHGLFDENRDERDLIFRVLEDDWIEMKDAVVLKDGASGEGDPVYRDAVKLPNMSKPSVGQGNMLAGATVDLPQERNRKNAGSAPVEVTWHPYAAGFETSQRDDYLDMMRAIPESQRVFAPEFFGQMMGVPGARNPEEMQDFTALVRDLGVAPSGGESFYFLNDVVLGSRVTRRLLANPVVYFLVGVLYNAGFTIKRAKLYFFRQAWPFKKLFRAYQYIEAVRNRAKFSENFAKGIHLPPLLAVNEQIELDGQYDFNTLRTIVYVLQVVSEAKPGQPIHAWVPAHLMSWATWLTANPGEANRFLNAIKSAVDAGVNPQTMNYRPVKGNLDEDAVIPLRTSVAAKREAAAAVVSSLPVGRLVRKVMSVPAMFFEDYVITSIIWETIENRRQNPEQVVNAAFQNLVSPADPMNKLVIQLNTLPDVYRAKMFDANGEVSAQGLRVLRHLYRLANPAPAVAAPVAAPVPVETDIAGSGRHVVLHSATTFPDDPNAVAAAMHGLEAAGAVVRISDILADANGIAPSQKLGDTNTIQSNAEIFTNLTGDERDAYLQRLAAEQRAYINSRGTVEPALAKTFRAFVAWAGGIPLADVPARVINYLFGAPDAAPLADGAAEEALGPVRRFFVALRAALQPDQIRNFYANGFHYDIPLSAESYAVMRPMLEQLADVLGATLQISADRIRFDFQPSAIERLPEVLEGTALYDNFMAWWDFVINRRANLDASYGSAFFQMLQQKIRNGGKLPFEAIVAANAARIIRGLPGDQPVHFFVDPRIAPLVKVLLENPNEIDRILNERDSYSLTARKLQEGGRTSVLARLAQTWRVPSWSRIPGIVHPISSRYPGQRRLSRLFSVVPVALLGLYGLLAAGAKLVGLLIEQIEGISNPFADGGWASNAMSSVSTWWSNLHVFGASAPAVEPAAAAPAAPSAEPAVATGTSMIDTIGQFFTHLWTSVSTGATDLWHRAGSVEINMQTILIGVAVIVGVYAFYKLIWKPSQAKRSAALKWLGGTNAGHAVIGAALLVAGAFAYANKDSVLSGLETAWTATGGHIEWTAVGQFFMTPSGWLTAAAAVLAALLIYFRQPAAKAIGRPAAAAGRGLAAFFTSRPVAWTVRMAVVTGAFAVVGGSLLPAVQGAVVAGVLAGLAALILIDQTARIQQGGRSALGRWTFWLVGVGLVGAGGAVVAYQIPALLAASPVLIGLTLAYAAASFLVSLYTLRQIKLDGDYFSPEDLVRVGLVNANEIHVRVDFNVPMDKQQRITDDYRI